MSAKKKTQSIDAKLDRALEAIMENQQVVRQVAAVLGHTTADADASEDGESSSTSVSVTIYDIVAEVLRQMGPRTDARETMFSQLNAQHRTEAAAARREQLPLDRAAAETGPLAKLTRTVDVLVDAVRKLEATVEAGSRKRSRASRDVSGGSGSSNGDGGSEAAHGATITRTAKHKDGRFYVLAALVRLDLLSAADSKRIMYKTATGEEIPELGAYCELNVEQLKQLAYSFIVCVDAAYTDDDTNSPLKHTICNTFGYAVSEDKNGWTEIVIKTIGKLREAYNNIQKDIRKLNGKATASQADEDDEEDDEEERAAKKHAGGKKVPKSVSFELHEYVRGLLQRAVPSNSMLNSTTYDWLAQTTRTLPASAAGLLDGGDSDGDDGNNGAASASSASAGNS